MEEPRHQNLRERTKEFALRVIRLVEALPATPTGKVVGNQVLRSATSVAANYREASRARSDAELVAKLGLVEQELDETILWFELLADSDTVRPALMTELLDEADQLLRIVVASIKTTKSRKHGGC
ncbi:MAG: four helix bundle protein [Planctomycetota bacterium]